MFEIALTAFLGALAMGLLVVPLILALVWRSLVCEREESERDFEDRHPRRRFRP